MEKKKNEKGKEAKEEVKKRMKERDNISVYFFYINKRCKKCTK